MCTRASFITSSNGSSIRSSIGFACAAALLAVVQLASSARASTDPGLVLALDRERFEITVHDVRSGEHGPPLHVTLGSPANPTPSGEFSLYWVILNPSWFPAPSAQRAGAVPQGPSLTSPMGAAKIPFAGGGSIALHGGGDPRLLGKPVSGGCVRSADGDLLRLIAWLHGQGALGSSRSREDGEVHRAFLRPARLIVR